MILGAYSQRAGGGGRFLPHNVEVGIAPTGARTFDVTIHEEGTGLTFRQEVTVTASTETRLLRLVAELHSWSVGLGLTATSARRALEQLGRALHQTFLGRRGGAVLEALRPTAVLLDVDESILGLPWEAMRTAQRELAVDCPFGRIVTTATTPVARRDPVDDDPVVKILAVVNPTDDLAATEAELTVLHALAAAPPQSGVTVKLDVIEAGEATRRGLTRAVDGADHDIVHFAGHARYDAGDPHHSALLLADGLFTADHVRPLAWASPPYLVFNSACESARAVHGRRLVATGGRANGLAAAFLAAGCEAYIGHFWPVGDGAAAEFAGTFYESLFRTVNAGAAVLDARRAVRGRFDDSADLAAFGAVFFGDAGSAAERRDLAQAV
jgi:hypothetical protein